MERVGRAEPFIQPSSWWHLFPVEVAFATTKDVNIKLGLECPKVLHLCVVVDINRESGNITKGKADMSIGFGMVKGIAKGLFVGKG